MNFDLKNVSADINFDFGQPIFHETLILDHHDFDKIKVDISTTTTKKLISEFVIILSIFFFNGKNKNFGYRDKCN